MKIEIGDKITFRNVKWIITERKVCFPTMVVFYRYKVYRKYFRYAWLNNTNCTYDIFPKRWNNLKKKLKENKNFHYTQLGYV